MLCTSHLLRLSNGILRRCRTWRPVPQYVPYSWSFCPIRASEWTHFTNIRFIDSRVYVMVNFLFCLITNWTHFSWVWICCVQNNTSYHSRAGVFSSMVGISLHGHFEIGLILYRSRRLRLCATIRKVAGSIPCALIVPLVYSVFHRNEYQGYLMTGKSGRCLRLTALLFSCADFLDIPGASNSWSPNG